MKLVLRDIRLGFIRGRRGYRAYRAEEPKIFWFSTTMAIMGAFLAYGIAIVLIIEAFSLFA